MVEERLHLSAKNCFENIEHILRRHGNWKKVRKMSPMEKKNNNKNTFNFVKCNFYACKNYFITICDNCYDKYIFFNFFYC